MLNFIEFKNYSCVDWLVIPPFNQYFKFFNQKIVLTLLKFATQKSIIHLCIIVKIRCIVHILLISDNRLE